VYAGSLLIILKFTSENHDVLQSDLDKLQEWTDQWNLYFNVLKWKVLHRGKFNPEYDYKMKIMDAVKNLESSAEERDLGVIFL